MGRVIEFDEVGIAGQTLRLKHESIPIDQLELDEDNPRIRYRLQHKRGMDAEQELLSWHDVIMLRKDIEQSGGLRERIIVHWDPKTKKYKVDEGNCRTASIRSLHQKNPKDPRWKTVIAKVLPPDADQKIIAIMLMDFHVVGKIQWKAHEKAAQVHKMSTKLKIPMDDIACYMRSSKTTVQRLLDAHKTMTDRFLTIDDGAYADKGEGAWSYFEELYKSPDLRAKMKADPDFVDNFCRWVGDARLPLGADVRFLPKIFASEAATKKFMAGNPKTAFAEAKKIIEQADPSVGSDFFKLMSKFREACTNAAQVKEILRIRTDKAARKQVLETYAALLDFMKLSDVEPEEPKEKDTAA